MSYTRVNWENLPSTNTPRNAENLNKMDKGISDIDQKINFYQLQETNNGGYYIYDPTNGLHTGDIYAVKFPVITKSASSIYLNNKGDSYKVIDAMGLNIGTANIDSLNCILFFDGTNFILISPTKHGGNIIPANGDLNNITKSGFYTCYSTTTGLSTEMTNTGYSWFIIHQNSNTGTAYATQRAVAYSSTLMVYERVKIEGTWGDWITGKTAYASALEGGYTGTEADFNTDLGSISGFAHELSIINGGA